MKLISFDEAWALKATAGYQYGDDALENVRLGYEMAEVQVALQPKLSAWITRSGEPFGTVSDKQLVVVFAAAIMRCEQRSGLQGDHSDTIIDKARAICARLLDRDGPDGGPTLGELATALRKAIES